MPGEYKYKGKIWGAASFAGVLALCYLALFGMTISNIAAFQSTEKKISSLTADLSQMEFSYLSKEAEINASLAASKGFVEPKNIVIAHSGTSQTAFAGKKTK